MSDKRRGFSPWHTGLSLGAVALLAAAAAWYASVDRGRAQTPELAASGTSEPTQDPAPAPTGRQRSNTVPSAIADLDQQQQRLLATMDGDEILASGRDATRRRIQELDSSFQRIPAHTRWALDTRAEIDTIIEQDMAQVMETAPTRHLTECRDEMCRVEVDFAGPTGAEEWSDLLVMSLAGTTPKTRMLVLEEADGSSKVVLYAMTTTGRRLATR